MHPVSCTNIHHDVTDLVNHEMAKNTKTWISRERNITFLRNKKILKLCLRWHILRSYHYVAEVTFKACVCYFLSKFYFPLNDSPSKTMKNVLFHLKGSLRSRDFQVFVFPSSLLSPPVSYCFRGWSKINLKVYSIIICPNENFIIYFEVKLSFVYW